jgi:hypothetical protein
LAREEEHMTERTERGFRVYGRIPSHGAAIVRVQESSLAMEGAHVWLFIDGEACTDHHVHGHSRPAPQLNVAQAKELISALSRFVKDAERGKLMEPAEQEDA